MIRLFFKCSVTRIKTFSLNFLLSLSFFPHLSTNSSFGILNWLTVRPSSVCHSLVFQTLGESNWHNSFLFTFVRTGVSGWDVRTLYSNVSTVSDERLLMQLHALFSFFSPTLTRINVVFDDKLHIFPPENNSKDCVSDVVYLADVPVTRSLCLRVTLPGYVLFRLKLMISYSYIQIFRLVISTIFMSSELVFAILFLSHKQITQILY